MEKDFYGYIEYIAASLQAEKVEELASELGRLGKFKASPQGGWEPVPYAGYTLITPTGNDDVINADLYREIRCLQNVAQCLLKSPKIVPAPARAFHMTVARLISGEAFARNIMGLREDDFLENLRKSLAKAPNLERLNFEIKGISILPQGVIAGLVSPMSEKDYQVLQNFRDLLYSDQALKTWGVERRRGFQGHITLFYIEDELSSQERMALADCLVEFNQRYFSHAVPFPISRIEIRKFDNFMKFYRLEDWPSYDFENTPIETEACEYECWGKKNL